jgi:hypothetical protein
MPIRSNHVDFPNLNQFLEASAPRHLGFETGFETGSTVNGTDITLDASPSSPSRVFITPYG